MKFLAAALLFVTFTAAGASAETPDVFESPREYDLYEVGNNNVSLNVSCNFWRKSGDTIAADCVLSQLRVEKSGETCTIVQMFPSRPLSFERINANTWRCIGVHTTGTLIFTLWRKPNEYAWSLRRVDTGSYGTTITEWVKTQQTMSCPILKF